MLNFYCLEFMFYPLLFINKNRKNKILLLHFNTIYLFTITVGL